jgi:hypothetical protein
VLSISKRLTNIRQRLRGAWHTMLMLSAWVVSVAATACVQAEDLLRYTVTLAPDFGSLRVEIACDACAKLPALRSLTLDAADLLDSAATSGLKHSGSKLIATTARRQASYSVTLRPERRGNSLEALTGTKLRMTDPRYWLWVPEDWSAERPIEVRFSLPDDYAVAAPWPRIGTDPYRYRVTPMLPAERGVVVFAPMQQSELNIGTAAIRINIIGSTSTHKKKYRDWIAATAQAVAQTFGHFPLPLTQIVVVPVKWEEGPVPFGHIVRGSGTTMILYVSQSATASALNDNWTLTHEMTHLAHPFLGAEGRWLAEGLAGYYQNVIRARSGALSPGTASANLLRSFKDTAEEQDHGPLDDAGRMRTYWTAAVMALDIDLQLRANPGKFNSLSQAMGAFSKLHLPSRIEWHPTAYMRALDKLAGTKIISKTYLRYANEQTFPEFEGLTSKAEALFAAQRRESPHSPSAP